MSSWVGADAAGDDEGVGSAGRRLDGLPHACRVVPDDRLVAVREPTIGQARGDLGGVRVDDLAEQELRADGEDLDVHAVTTVAVRSVP